MAALLAAALELEHARVAANKPFTRMTLEPLKVIVKCVFKLKGMAGASKLTKKDDQVTYLEQQGDISALLESEVAPRENSSPGPTTTAQDGPLTQQQRDNIASIDAKIAALLAERSEQSRALSFASPPAGEN